MRLVARLLIVTTLCASLPALGDEPAELVAVETAAAPDPASPEAPAATPVAGTPIAFAALGPEDYLSAASTTTAIDDDAEYTEFVIGFCVVALLGFGGVGLKTPAQH